MELEQKDGKIFISQRGYKRSIDIKDLLSLYGMTDCNEVNAPMDINQKFNEEEESQICDDKIYQELLGRLMYLSVATRPDILHMHLVCRNLANLQKWCIETNFKIFKKSN